MTQHRMFDLSRVKVLPLARRKNFCEAADVIVDPESEPAPLNDVSASHLDEAARCIIAAKERNASLMLTYGAHLLRNGAVRIVDQLMEHGWITHLATNGAGSIHDWEFAWQGATSESVKMNVADGTFGTWDETATNIHLAIMTGVLDGLGYGQSMGRYIANDGVDLPSARELEQKIAASPADPLTSARADLLQTLRKFEMPPGHRHIEHRWKQASMLTCAWRHGVPATVHPGVGYDIIANHPIFCGAAIGRAAEIDFKLFAGSVENLNDGVVLNVGSAIMGPQVFEKTLSCVNNLRRQSGQGVISGHNIFVVDIQDGGNWDWTQGEPPKDHPAYYLRFCKSYSRMGGAMHYVQCDNVQFVHHLWKRLQRC